MAKKKQFAVFGLGRFGSHIMTFMLELITQKTSTIKYPPEDIMIG